MLREALIHTLQIDDHTLRISCEQGMLVCFLIRLIVRISYLCEQGIVEMEQLCQTPGDLFLERFGIFFTVFQSTIDSTLIALDTLVQLFNVQTLELGSLIYDLSNAPGTVLFRKRVICPEP